MVKLFKPSWGDHDTQPDVPIGAAGSHGLWGSPETSRGDTQAAGWEAMISGEALLDAFTENSGWSGAGWHVSWSIQVTNMQGTVRDTLSLRFRYKPFRWNSLTDTWSWFNEPITYYGAFATHHKREYLALKSY